MSNNDPPHPDDALCNLVIKCPYLQNLALSWQHGITSFGKCANLNSAWHMKLLKMNQISELPPLKDVAAFINKHMVNDGRLCLFFVIPFSDNYAEQIKSFVNSKNFQVEVAPEEMSHNVSVFDEYDPYGFN